MSTVYFKAIQTGKGTAEVSKEAANLFSRLMEDEHIELGSYVPLKVHFGEKGNETFIPAAGYEGLIRLLTSRGIASAYIETNVLYRGERQNRTAHVQLARDHGFTQLPIVIADGEYGDEYTEVPIGGRHFDTCMIGKEIALLNQMIVLSHFKGHRLAGFGGAVKQLAMGCASRGGKLAQHANAIPKINSRKCDACGKCAEKCPMGAIALQPKALIEKSKCVGCASCMAVCEHGAFSNSWWASFGKKFRERLAEHAAAAAKDKSSIYINFALSITRGCDCESHKMTPFMQDVGILASVDPVAVDAASLDLVQERKGRKIFNRGRHTLAHARTVGLGATDYRLIEI